MWKAIARAVRRQSLMVAHTLLPPNVSFTLSCYIPFYFICACACVCARIHIPAYVCLSICLRHHCNAPGCQERALVNLELELLAVVSLGAGNQTQVTCKGRKCSSPPPPAVPWAHNPTVFTNCLCSSRFLLFLYLTTLPSLICRSTKFFWPGTYYVHQASLELIEIHQPPPPES